jgi:hypothetical protein
MKRYLYKVECNTVKKIKIHNNYNQSYRVNNKRKADNILYGNDKKRSKHVNEIYTCVLHGEKYICDMYECDGRIRNVIQNIMPYIN